MCTQTNPMSRPQKPGSSGTRDRYVWRLPRLQWIAVLSLVLWHALSTPQCCAASPSQPLNRRDFLRLVRRGSLRMFGRTSSQLTEGLRPDGYPHQVQPTCQSRCSGCGRCACDSYEEPLVRIECHVGANCERAVLKRTWQAPPLEVVWLDHRGKVLTFEDRRIISDERISLERPYVKEWNLHVRSVRPSDDGKYTCQVDTDPVQVRPVYLNVHEPAKIIDHLSSPATVTVQEGETVELVCNVTGVPQPTVTWYRIPRGLMEDTDRKDPVNGRKQIGVAGEVLVIHNVTRYCDDVYECIAYNNVPPAAQRSIRVYVQFPPEVRLPNHKIGQTKGKTTILECVVTAYPHAMTKWRRNGKDIVRNSKYNIEIYDEDENTMTLALRIQHLSQEDYGQYKCISTNLLGEDSETMMLYEYRAVERTSPSTTTTTTVARKPPSRQNPDHGHGNGRNNGGRTSQHNDRRKPTAGGKTAGEAGLGGANPGEGGGNGVNWWENSNAAAQGYKDNNDDDTNPAAGGGAGGAGGGVVGGGRHGVVDGGNIRDPGYTYGTGNVGGPRNQQVIEEPESRGATLSGPNFLLALCVSAVTALTLLR